MKHTILILASIFAASVFADSTMATKTYVNNKFGAATNAVRVIVAEATNAIPRIVSGGNEIAANGEAVIESPLGEWTPSHTAINQNPQIGDHCWRDIFFDLDERVWYCLYYEFEEQGWYNTSGNIMLGDYTNPDAPLLYFPDGTPTRRIIRTRLATTNDIASVAMATNSLMLTNGIVKTSDGGSTVTAANVGARPSDWNPLQHDSDELIEYSGYGRWKITSILWDKAGPISTSNEVESLVYNRIDHTNTRFSNEVLAVGIGISSNDVAVIRDMVGAVGDIPIGGGAATLGGLLVALISAVVWLKGHALTNGMTGGVPDDPNVSTLFSSANTSLNLSSVRTASTDATTAKSYIDNAISDACPYGVNVLTAPGDLQLVDGCVNTITLNAADVHLVLPAMPIGKQADLLIEITVAAGATVSGFSIVAPTGATMQRIRMTDDVTVEAPASGTTIYQFMYTSRRTDNGTGTPAYRVYSAQKKGEVVV